MPSNSREQANPCLSVLTPYEQKKKDEIKKRNAIKTFSHKSFLQAVNVKPMYPAAIKDSHTSADNCSDLHV